MQSKLVKTGRRVLYTAAIACILLVPFMAPSGALAASGNEFEELRQMVEELKSKLDRAERRIEEMSRNVSGNTQAVEAASAAIESVESKSSPLENLSIGGFGEVHYNNLDSGDSDDDNQEIDFHRLVLHFEYEYSDNLRFSSEVEFEHGGEEVALEQAFIEYDFDERNTGRAGVFLLPVGILNEEHEPPTFYGVERNLVETAIIPTGWWAGGASFTHSADNGVSLDLVVHEGLKVDPQPDGTVHIRDGRQNTSEAKADDLAFTGRLKYTGTPGLELAAAVQYQSDLAQDTDPVRNSSDTATNDISDAWLYEAHVLFNRGPFGLRALYARWDIDADGDSEAYDEQDGWYVEPSWKFNESFGVFARYADVDGGRPEDQFDQWTLGFNYWLNDHAVLKADYQDRSYDNDDYDADGEDNDFDGFNLGVGFEF